MTRVSRRALACALLATTALSAPAFAQSAPAPKFIQVDENGVDLTSGQFFWSLPEGSIGAGDGALEWVRYWTGQGGWRDTWTGAMYTQTAGGVSTVHVEMGPIGDTFTCSGGVCTNTKGNGATLSGSTYTSADGTTISFTSAGPDLGYPLTGGYPCTIADAGTCAVPTQVHKPSGMTFNLGWDLVERCMQYDPDLNCITPATYFRLRTLTSSGNYKLTVNYASDNSGSGVPGHQTPPPSDWYKRTNVQFTNLASPPSTLPTVTYAYNTSGNISSVTDTGGRAWGITMGAQGPTGIRRPGAAGDTTTIAYNSTTGLVSSVTKEGVTKTYSRSVVGNTGTITVTDPLSDSKVITSDLTVGRPTSLKDELNRTTSFQYDSNGRLTRTTLPEGNYTQLTYDSRGNITERRQVAKSGSGLPDIVSSASFDSTCTNLVKCNEPNSTTDARGFTTDYVYDATHGGVTSVTRPAPSTGAVRPQVRYTYTQVTAVTGQPVYLLTGTSACQTQSSCAGTSDEVKASTTYNTSNLLPVSSSKGDGTGVLTATSAMTYDSIGNLSTVDGPLSGTADTTKYRYNDARQIVGVTLPDPDGAGSLKMRATRNTYTNGLLTKVEKGTVNSQSDADWSLFSPSETTDITYDANARESTRKLSGGGTAYGLTQTSYDSLGRVDCSAVRMNTAIYGSLPASACTLGTQGSFGPDRISQAVYDAAGEVTQQKVAVGTTDAATERTLTYSNNGLLQTLKDAMSNLTTYEYDGQDRLSKTDFPNPTQGAGTSSTTDYEQLTYENTQSNTRTSGTVASRRLRDGTSIAFSHDNLGRVTLKDLPRSEPDVSYAYDNLDRLTSASQTGNALSFTYDALGDKLTETGPQGTATSQYDLAGERTQLTYPGTGLYLNYDYLVTGEVSKVRENGATSGVGVLATYGYDDLGRRTSITFGNGASQAFTYDAVSRLASLSNDLSGTTNDLSATFSYNPASQITSTVRTGDTYAWTGHGNGSTAFTQNGLNQQVSIGGSTANWDSKGNLTSEPQSGKTYGYSSENLLTSASGGVTLGYDPAMRLYQVAGATTTRFAYDGANAIAEFDGSNVLQRRFVFGSGVDDPIVWYEGSGTTDRRFLNSDERGSIISLTDSTGGLIAINRYDEYGKPQSTNQGRFQYTGQKWISEANLYDYKARDYLAHLGIFAQTDPGGYASSPNFYAYGLDNPVNVTDPSGSYVATSSFGDDSGNAGMMPGSAGLDTFNFQWDGVAIANISGRIDEITLNRGSEALFKLKAISAQTGVPLACVLNCSLEQVKAWAEINASPFAFLGLGNIAESGTNRPVQPLSASLAAQLREPVFAQEVGREILNSHMFGGGARWEYGFWAAHDLFTGDFIAGYTHSGQFANEQAVGLPNLWPWQSISFYFHIHPWGFSNGLSGLSRDDINVANAFHITIISFSPNGFDWYKGR